MPADFTTATQCTSYLHGVRDSLSLDLGSGPTICPSPQVTTFQLARVFVKHAEEHPAALHQDAFVVVIAAFAANFPCGPATRA